MLCLWMMPIRINGWFKAYREVLKQRTWLKSYITQRLRGEAGLLISSFLFMIHFPARRKCFPWLDYSGLHPVRILFYTGNRWNTFIFSSQKKFHLDLWAGFRTHGPSGLAFWQTSWWKKNIKTQTTGRHSFCWIDKKIIHNIIKLCYFSRRKDEQIWILY